MIYTLISFHIKIRNKMGQNKVVKILYIIATKHLFLLDSEYDLNSINETKPPHYLL